MITQEWLKSVLHYNPDTGMFTWLKSRGTVKKYSIAGCVHSSGYVFIKVNGKNYKAHRLAFLYMTGKFPPADTDHVNGIYDDNRWINLRSVSHAENAKNIKISKNNTSKIMGVGKDGSSYRARITVDDVLIHLMQTRDFFEACCARKSAELRYGFHANHGRTV